MTYLVEGAREDVNGMAGGDGSFRDGGVMLRRFLDELGVGSLLLEIVMRTHRLGQICGDHLPGSDGAWTASKEHYTCAHIGKVGLEQ